MDGCNSAVSSMDKAYPAIGSALAKSGRNMLYSCSWPDYVRLSGQNPNYTAVAQNCNIWRNFDDIQDSWASVLSIIEYFGNNPQLADFAGPGAWNDPDMLIVGDFSLTLDESRVQMAIWAIMGAPLLMVRCASYFYTCFLK